MTERERLISMLRWWADRVRDPELQAVLLQAADEADHVATLLARMAGLLKTEEYTNWSECENRAHYRFDEIVLDERSRPDGLVSSWAAASPIE